MDTALEAVGHAGLECIIVLDHIRQTTGIARRVRYASLGIGEEEGPVFRMRS